MDSWGINPSLPVGTNGIVVNDILNGFIIESGSNENGNYIKFSNGQMICYDTKNFTVDITKKYNEYIYYGYINKVSDFPVNFKEKPNVIFCHHSSDSVFAIQPYRIETISIDQTGGVYPISVSNANNQGLSVTYFAIGRWK